MPADRGVPNYRATSGFDIFHIFKFSKYVKEFYEKKFVDKIQNL